MSLIGPLFTFTGGHAVLAAFLLIVVALLGAGEWLKRNKNH
jgi:hypothetical protein